MITLYWVVAFYQAAADSRFEGNHWFPLKLVSWTWRICDKSSETHCSFV